METTAEKLYKILNSKEEIKQALIAKGINITDETTFAEYAEKINEITNGGAITDEEALLFIKDVAEGKRKIAKAVRNKYEGTSGTASEVTEYSTFDELSKKISQIPVEVPMGSAMEQNGGVLPFYDVYNEALKAMKEFAGYGFNGVCAFELDKWSYDNDHTITLSGADAYYTSDGTFIKDNIIYKNGTQIGELDNSLYQFQDVNAENTNRFVVFFSETERYTVPKSLPATSCLNLWCVKGTPQISFNGNYTALNSINVYDGELEVLNSSDFCARNLTSLQHLNLLHIRSINTTEPLFQGNTTLKLLRLKNLETLNSSFGTGLFQDVPIHSLIFDKLEEIKGGVRIGGNSNWREILFPKLKTLESSSNLIQSASYLEKVSFDELEEITSNTQIFYIVTANHINFPKLKNTKKGILGSSYFNLITLGKPIGGNIKIIESGSMTKECSVVIEQGFKSTLNMGYLTALTTESVHNIIDNLAPCDTKGQYTITLSNSVTISEEYENKLVNEKLYTLARLG